jgi:glycosyltransferase involved in cell wall biosynthesis
MAQVSVVLPVFNGAATIGRTLSSVFAQTFPAFETIVVDDGSIDETPSILASYANRIRIIRQPNRGVSASRNAGIRAARGEYVAFIDDDDEWRPEMLSRCAAILDQDPNCVLAYTGAFRVDQDGRLISNQESQISDVDSPTLAQMLERPWNVVPSQFVVRREIAERCGGFDERLTTCEDLYFLMLAREHGHFRGVREALVRKATRPLYPKALNRDPGCELFVRIVRERYGASAAGFIKEFRRKRMKVMKHMARLLLEEGRIIEARRCLARVIHYEPTSIKAYRRYLRTFIPRRTLASRAEDSEA